MSCHVTWPGRPSPSQSAVHTVAQPMSSRPAWPPAATHTCAGKCICLIRSTLLLWGLPKHRHCHSMPGQLRSSASTSRQQTAPWETSAASNGCWTGIPPDPQTRLLRLHYTASEGVTMAAARLHQDGHGGLPNVTSARNQLHAVVPQRAALAPEHWRRRRARPVRRISWPAHGHVRSTPCSGQRSGQTLVARTVRTRT